MHEGRGRWVGSNKVVELKKKKKKRKLANHSIVRSNTAEPGYMQIKSVLKTESDGRLLGKKKKKSDH